MAQLSVLLFQRLLSSFLLDAQNHRRAGFVSKSNFSRQSCILHDGRNLRFRKLDQKHLGALGRRHPGGWAMPVSDWNAIAIIQPTHSITSSALANNVAGTVMPRARAVLRLIASSIFVYCCTGKLDAF